MGVAFFFGAAAFFAAGFAADLVTRPDLVLLRTVGFSTTALAYNCSLALTHDCDEESSWQLTAFGAAAFFGAAFFGAAAVFLTAAFFGAASFLATTFFGAAAFFSAAGLAAAFLVVVAFFAAAGAFLVVAVAFFGAAAFFSAAAFGAAVFFASLVVPDGPVYALLDCVAHI